MTDLEKREKIQTTKIRDERAGYLDDGQIPSKTQTTNIDSLS